MDKATVFLSIDVFDYFLVFAIFLICLGGSWISFEVRNNHLPFYWTALSGTLITCIWVYIVKWSKCNLFLISAWIDVAAALGYFIGLSLLGEPVTTQQTVGIILLVIGLFLVG